MELRYQIPKHLEGFIGNIPEPQLCSLVTMLFEYAIQHRMLDYPRTEIEDSVDEIRQLVGDLKSKQSLENSLMLQMLSSMNTQLASMQQLMLSGNMPSIPEGVQIPMNQFMPMYYQAPAPAQETYKETSKATEASDDKVIDESEIKGVEGDGDEVQTSFESDIFG